MARRFWTDDEVRYLREHYRRKPAPEIAKHLNRTTKAIHEAAKSYRISVPRFRFTPENGRRIYAMNADGLTDSEIARRLGCDRKAVSRYRRDNGLPCNTHSEWAREQVRRRTREWLAKAGLNSLAEVRSKAFRDYARKAGWPSDLKPRAVQILNALYVNGPMTRRELAKAVGLQWRGSRASLKSGDDEGSYLAHLMARGFVVSLGKVVKGKGKGGSTNLYSLPLS